MSSQKHVAGVPVVSDKTRDVLSERELVDYSEHKRKLLKWALSVGKDPRKAEGYSESTVSHLTYQIGTFYRWLWEEHDQYTLRATPEDADAYMRELALEEMTNAHKSAVQKCLKRLFKYRRYELGEEIEWEPEHTFSETHSQPRDFLTREERSAIREAALEYGSVPSYNGLSPEERDEWKAHLAQRFDKPKFAVGPEDFERANGWKFASLVWTSLDAGLRPIEVGRARTYWVDVDNKVLRIPKAESSKNADNWTVALSERTAQALSRWLDERERYEVYDDTDALWLTREGNPYAAQALRRLIHRLCELAEIPIENRQMSWYTIRHSVGTYFAREEDLAAAQAQLRHKSPKTTMKYDQAPVEDRQDALDRMG